MGAVLVGLWLLAALLAPLAPYPPEQVGAGAVLEAPSLSHPFGTDALGRELLSRVLYGARIALRVALIGTAISATLGLGLGLLAGFYAGWLDQGLSRVMDVWLAFPGLLLAVVIVARLGPSLDNAVIALGIIGAPAFYRLMRSGTLSMRHADHVVAARAIGAHDRRIMTRHVLPNLASSIIVLLTLRMGYPDPGGRQPQLYRRWAPSHQRPNGARFSPPVATTWTPRPGWPSPPDSASPSP